MESDEARRLMEALTEANQPPFQVIGASVDDRWSFAVRHSALERDSDEEPPVRIDDRADVIPIDEVLGLYTPEDQTITIFTKGIAKVSTLLGVPKTHLRFVVRLHEWAHALMHIGLSEHERLRVNQDETVWPEMLAAATERFRLMDRRLHERLAQLLTLHALKRLRANARAAEARAALDSRIHAFEQLAQRSPTDYRIDKYASVSRERIRDSIGLLNEGGIVGLNAWDRVVTW